MSAAGLVFGFFGENVLDIIIGVCWMVRWIFQALLDIVGIMRSLYTMLCTIHVPYDHGGMDIMRST